MDTLYFDILCDVSCFVSFTETSQTSIWTLTNCDTQLASRHAAVKICLEARGARRKTIKLGLPVCRLIKFTSAENVFHIFERAIEFGDMQSCQYLTCAWRLHFFKDCCILYHFCKLVVPKTGKLLSSRFAPNHLLGTAAKNGHLEICQWLTEHFQLRNARLDGNNHALSYTAEYGHLQTLQWLVEHFKAEKYGPDESDVSPALWHAAKKGHWHVCHYLINQFGLLPGILGRRVGMTSWEIEDSLKREENKSFQFSWNK